MSAGLLISAPVFRAKQARQQTPFHPRARREGTAQLSENEKNREHSGSKDGQHSALLDSKSLHPLDGPDTREARLIPGPLLIRLPILLDYSIP